MRQPRPAWQRTATPSAKVARALQLATDAYTATRLIERGAVATPMGGKTTLRVPGEQMAVTLPTEAVELAKAQAREAAAMFGGRGNNQPAHSDNHACAVNGGGDT